jgi:hypothetical protein
MAPFEALYGRKCRTHLNWVESRERRYYIIDFIEEAEQQSVSSRKIWQLQAKQKSYVDKQRKPIEFEVGGYVYLKVSLMKGVQRFGVKKEVCT